VAAIHLKQTDPDTVSAAPAGKLSLVGGDDGQLWVVSAAGEKKPVSEAAFDPLDYPGLQLWLDAANPACQDLRAVMSLDRASTNYITGTGTASLPVTNRFTIEMWINQRTLSDNVNFASHGRYGQSGVAWGLASANSPWGGNSVRFWIADNTSGTSYVQRQTPLNASSQRFPMSQMLIVYDGTQSNAADRLSIYINGELQTLTGTGAVPASLQTITQPLFVGGWGGLSGTLGHKSLDGAIVCFRYWNVALDTPTGTTAATYLWNAGKPRYLSDLTSTYNSSNLLINLEKGAWNCNKSATQFTQVGGGSINKAFTVSKAFDLSNNRRVYDLHHCAIEPWLTVDSNGVQCWETFAQHHLKSMTPDLAFFTTGEFFTAIEQVEFLGAEGFYLGSQQYPRTASRYILSGWVNASGIRRPFLRVRNESSPDGTWTALADAITVGTPNLHHWRGLFEGSVASVEYRRNNAQKTATNVNLGNSPWGSVVPGQSHSFVSAFDDGQYDRQRVGIIAAFGPRLSNTQSQQVAKNIARLRSINLDD
jgi:hypothetical protein